MVFFKQRKINKFFDKIYVRRFLVVYSRRVESYANFILSEVQL